MSTLLAVALRRVIGTVRSLPAWIAYGFADLFAPIVVAATFFTRHRSTYRKRGFYRNTAIVFRGTLRSSERRRLLWRWARHMTHLAVDLCRMPRVTPDNREDYCDFEEFSVVHERFAEGRGVLGTSGHVGSYEYMSYLTALCGLPITTVFRESPLPVLTDVLNEVRSKGSGQTMVERKGAVRVMLRALRQGEILGIIADVSSKESEVFAPFLGTDAATNNTAGVLHLKTGAPIFVITTQRIGRQRFKIHVWDTIEVEPSDDRTADLVGIARRINAGLTRAIIEYPEQWFWDSRRFRQRPEGEERDENDMPAQVDPAPAAAIRRRLANR